LLGRTVPGSAAGVNAMREVQPKRLLLIGGGHAHLAVIAAFGRKPEPGVEVVLLSRDRLTPYSAMLPGGLSGRYRRKDVHINLDQLCAASHVRFVVDEAIGFDCANKQVLRRGGASLGYDVLSIDVGIESNINAIPGAANPGTTGHVLPVKPVHGLLARWDVLKASMTMSKSTTHLAVIGGGAAGVELVLAMAARLRKEIARVERDTAKLTFTLIAGENLLPQANPRMRKLAAAALRRAGVVLVAGARVRQINTDHLELDDRSKIAANLVVLATRGVAPSWLAQGDLPLSDTGFVAVRQTLQVMGDENVFAAGDCAQMISDPRPKAGVFAVRQGYVLARNLRRHLRGKALAIYQPQRTWLSIIDTADGSAIAGRGRWFAVQGRWVMLWKTWLDRRFVRFYSQ
jgi:pyridine nucleotide-disulfide oxidoreductase family protein